MKGTLKGQSPTVVSSMEPVTPPAAGPPTSTPVSSSEFNMGVTPSAAGPTAGPLGSAAMRTQQQQGQQQPSYNGTPTTTTPPTTQRREEGKEQDLERRPASAGSDEPAYHQPYSRDVHHGEHMFPGVRGHEAEEYMKCEDYASPEDCREEVRWKK